jgi:nucleoside-diphosphate-sugar epimerase
MEEEMNKPMAVILGAGPVGLAVGSGFAQRGIAVRYVTRSGRPVPGAESVAADVRESSALEEASKGATVLVNAVGAPYQHWERDLPPIQNAVLAAARVTGAVAVFAENLYSYDARVLPLTELSAEVPPTRKGALRLRLSQQWLEAHRSGSVRGVAVRASDYFGPGATRSPNSHFGSRFFPGLEAGKPVAFLGNPDALHSFTYLPDYARALVDVALDSRAWGRSWIAPSLPPTTARTVAGLFAAQAGRAVKVGRLPSTMVKLLGVFDPMIREVVEMLYQFEREFTVDASAWEAHFGWKATELEQAVRDTWAAHKAL